MVGWKPLSWPVSLDGATPQLLSAAWLLYSQGPTASLQLSATWGVPKHWSLQGIFLDLGITPVQTLKKCGNGAGGASPKMSQRCGVDSRGRVQLHYLLPVCL